MSASGAGSARGPAAGLGPARDPRQTGLSRSGAAPTARSGPRGLAQRPQAKGCQMMRVIDMECSVPKPPDAAPPGTPPPAVPNAPRAGQPAGYGMANYERIFRSRKDGGDPRPGTALSALVDLLR